MPMEFRTGSSIFHRSLTPISLSIIFNEINNLSSFIAEGMKNWEIFKLPTSRDGLELVYMLEKRLSSKVYKSREICWVWKICVPEKKDVSNNVVITVTII